SPACQTGAMLVNMLVQVAAARGCQAVLTSVSPLPAHRNRSTAEGSYPPILCGLARALPVPAERFGMRLEETADMTPKNRICLWFDKDAEDAARFYAATFPDSAVTAVVRSPSDFPSGKAGDVLTVDFT